MDIFVWNIPIILLEIDSLIYLQNLLVQLKYECEYGGSEHVNN